MQATAIQNPNAQGEINQKLESIMSLLSVKKVYYVDDAFELNTGKDEFKALVSTGLSQNLIGELRKINLQGINFNKEEEILLDHIEEVWDEIANAKKLKYFEKLYDILKIQSDVIHDYKASNSITNFFSAELLELLKPFEWDERNKSIFDSLKEDEKIIVLIDQDLDHAKEGRYSETKLRGEDLIAEVKAAGNINKSILVLFTHTIQEHHSELERRREIVDARQDLEVEDFLALKKGRLQKPNFFADGIKKACLNKRFEGIKNLTLEVFKDASTDSSKEIDRLDTYIFEDMVLRSSLSEGVWEGETFIRIFNIYLNDNFKSQIDQKGYTAIFNNEISIAKQVGNVEFDLQDDIKPNNSKYSLRHKELYEQASIINRLRLGIANGDVFEIYEGANLGQYILIAQECDLIVRSDGKRSGKYGYLFKVEVMPQNQLQSEIENRAKKGVQYFADKFELSYYEFETNRSGIIRLADSIVVDLSVLDLVAFNSDGISGFDFGAPQQFDYTLYNISWLNRYEMLVAFLKEKAECIEKVYNDIAGFDAPTQVLIKRSISWKLAFNNDYGNIESYRDKRFNFGIRRVKRLRETYAKGMLDKYSRYFSRNAELHDFAK